MKDTVAGGQNRSARLPARLVLVVRVPALALAHEQIEGNDDVAVAVGALDAWVASQPLQRPLEPATARLAPNLDGLVQHVHSIDPALLRRNRFAPPAAPPPARLYCF